ncbi:MAG: adenosylcobinamide-GDP ribazoletransferase [Lachnospiraceae bacterium]
MKGLGIALAMYSKIPMPNLDFSEKNRRYAICFFPVVGVIIGVAMYAFYASIAYLIRSGVVVSEGFYTALMLAIPVVITGGIHIDGYMDTQDALHSYQSKERKLEILKDSHVGAFAVIMLLLYYLVLYGAYSQIFMPQQVVMLGISFILSRCLSGLAVVSFQGARTEGMLYSFSSTAHKVVVKSVLFVMLAAVFIGLCVMDIKTGSMVVAGNVFLFLYYKYKAYKEFGGITGDLAGWYLQLSELVSALLIAGGTLL